MNSYAVCRDFAKFASFRGIFSLRSIERQIRAKRNAQNAKERDGRNRLIGVLFYARVLLHSVQSLATCVTRLRSSMRDLSCVREYALEPRNK